MQRRSSAIRRSSADPPYFGQLPEAPVDTGFLRWMFNTLFVAGS